MAALQSREADCNDLFAVMSDKAKQIYECSKCGAQFPKWNGRCLECGSWGTLNREIRAEKKGESEKSRAEPAEILNLEQVEQPETERLKTNLGEVDRVFGGGLVPGSLTLLGGEPGIGKSTLVAQIADRLSGKEAVYVSGEESAFQVKARLQRLGCSVKGINFIGETKVEKILASLEKLSPGLVIIDSIQTVYSEDSEAEAGGVSQIRVSTVKFLEWAKKNNVSVLIVGHVTKDGQVAGPKTLEHIVDTVAYLEKEINHAYSILRAVKNRFGSLNEIGILEMTGAGFEEVANPSQVFLEEQGAPISGSVISCIQEGTRPFLVNIQSLVSKTLFGYPQRKASGFDINRLQILTSVISKRTKVNLANQDVVLNIVGGLKVNDPALDLAVCLAIISSLLNQVVEKDTLVLGEVGLGGEIRNVSQLEERLKEAEKLGFKKAITPNVKIKNTKLEIKKISNIEEIINLLKIS